MKTGAERVPWICGLIMPERQRVHKNNYSKRACDSVAPDSSCLAWLNDGLARCELEWCQVTVNDLTGMQSQQQQQSVCGPTARRARLHDVLVAY